MWWCPSEPTESMLTSGHTANKNGALNKPLKQIYRAMISAAPVSTERMVDSFLLDWLEKQIVNVIELDDGRLIDVKGNSVRKAIREALSPQPQEDK